MQQGLQRETAGTGGAAEVAQVVRSVCTATLGGDLDVQIGVRCSIVRARVRRGRGGGTSYDFTLHFL